MDLESFGQLTRAYDGVRRVRTTGLARWEYRGRLIARELDRRRVVIRVPFEAREVLIRLHPTAFSVPPRFTRHMMVVADLTSGDDAAVEEALESAWRYQSGTG